MITLFIARPSALTDATLDAVERVLLLDGGEQTQAWQWRRGEAAVICGVGDRGRETWIIVREGLRAGVPKVYRHVGGIGPLLEGLHGRPIRVGMRRVRHGNGHQRVMARRVRKRGRTWRWIRAERRA